MRTNINVQPGQVWRSSDPRRLRQFEVLSPGVFGNAIVRMVYPHRGQIQLVNPNGFEVTGTKGYTRVR